MGGLSACRAHRLIPPGFFGAVSGIFILQRDLQLVREVRHRQITSSTSGLAVIVAGSAPLSITPTCIDENAVANRCIRQIVTARLDFTPLVRHSLLSAVSRILADEPLNNLINFRAIETRLDIIKVV